MLKKIMNLLWCRSSFVNGNLGYLAATVNGSILHYFLHESKDIVLKDNNSSEEVLGVVNETNYISKNGTSAFYFGFAVQIGAFFKKNKFLPFFIGLFICNGVFRIYPKTRVVKVEGSTYHVYSTLAYKNLFMDPVDLWGPRRDIKN